MKDTLDFISIVPWQMIMQWANLLIIVLLIRRFLFKPVMAILDKRNAEVEKIYSEAGELHQRADTACKQYEEKIGSADAEVDTMLRDAAQKTQARSEQALQEAQRKASEMLEKGKAQLEQERKKAFAEVKSEISGIAIDIASKVLGKELDDTKHRELIDSFIENVGER